MSEPSKLQQQTIDFTSAWDEHKRTFDRLRDLMMDDEQRKEALDEYLKAARAFETARAALSK